MTDMGKDNFKAREMKSVKSLNTDRSQAEAMQKRG